MLQLPFQLQVFSKLFQMLLLDHGLPEQPPLGRIFLSTGVDFIFGLFCIALPVLLEESQTGSVVITVIVS